MRGCSLSSLGVALLLLGQILTLQYLSDDAEE